MNNSVLALLGLILYGCIPPSNAVLKDELVVIEARKVREIEVGMSVAEVERHMGTEPYSIYPYTSSMMVTHEARPVRTDKFLSKDGKRVTVYFYRTAVKNRDSVCSDDETTAVVFVDGKVDALLPGEKSKEVIEVRFR